MANIYKGTLGLIGNTPLVEVTNVEKELGLEATILVKLEYFNPAGSVKDRIAKAMIEDAEAKGLLKEGSVIIEPTSGNTGIGLAAAATVKGYRMILTMPETMSVERRNIVKAYGAEVVLTDGAPIKAATAGGKAAKSINSSLIVFDTAPIMPVAMASFMGLLNISEKPSTPQKLIRRRSKTNCHRRRFTGRKATGLSPSRIARIQAVIVATVIIISEYTSLSVPERMSSFAKSMPLVIKGNPGMIKSIEQI